MTARHRIEQLDVELECDVPGAAAPDEDALARLVRTVLLPAVADVLDALDDPGAVLTVPEIALDLGEIEQAAVHEEAPLRLRALLADALAEAKRTAGGANGPAQVGAARDRAARVGAGDDGLAQLAGFLAGGRLPWHADFKRRDLHADLLAQALAGPRAPLLRMLDGVLRRPAALRRLAEQFPAAQVRALLAVVDADDAAPAPWRQALATAVGAGAARPVPPVAGGTGNVAETGAMRSPARAAGRIGVAANPEAVRLLAPPAGGSDVRADAGAVSAMDVVADAAGASAAAGDTTLPLKPAPVNRATGTLERGAAVRAVGGDHTVAGAAQHAGPRARVPVGAAEDTAWSPAAAVGTSGAADSFRAQSGAATDGRTAPPVLTALAGFLRNGRIDAGMPLPADAADPAHVVCLDAALAVPSADLAAVLRAALRHPDSARRLVEQFPSRQQIAIVRALAPGHAAALLTLFAALQDARPADVGHGAGRVAAWLIVLGLALEAPDAQIDAAVADAEAALRMRGPGRDGVAAGAAGERRQRDAGADTGHERDEPERVAAGRAGAARSMTPQDASVGAGLDADVAAGTPVGDNVPAAGGVADDAVPAAAGTVQASGSRAATGESVSTASGRYLAERAEGAPLPYGSPHADRLTAIVAARHPDGAAPLDAGAAASVMERDRRIRSRAADAAAYRSFLNDEPSGNPGLTPVEDVGLPAAGADAHPSPFGDAHGAATNNADARAGAGAGVVTAPADEGSGAVTAPADATHWAAEHTGGTAPHEGAAAGLSAAAPGSASLGADDGTGPAPGQSAHAPRAAAGRDGLTAPGLSAPFDEAITPLPPAAPYATTGAAGAFIAAAPAQPHPSMPTRTARTDVDAVLQHDASTAADANRAASSRPDEMATGTGDATGAHATTVAATDSARPRSGSVTSARMEAHPSTAQTSAAAASARADATTLPGATPTASAIEAGVASDIGAVPATPHPSAPPVPVADGMRRQRVPSADETIAQARAGDEVPDRPAPVMHATHAASTHTGGTASGLAGQPAMDDVNEWATASAPPPTALLARLLEGPDTRGRATLRSALARLLAAPDGTRRLATVIPERLRAPLVRLLAPGPADALLAVLGETDARIAAQRHPDTHARQLRTLCWEQVFAACAAAPTDASGTLRGRLAAVLAQAAKGQRRTTPRAAAERLLAFLRTGRLAGPATGADAPGALLDLVLASPYRGADWWTALAQVLAEPQALRRLVTQFAGHALAALVRCAVSDRADAWLALAAVPDPADGAPAWSVLVAAAVRTAAGLDDVPDTAILLTRIEEAAGAASADAAPADAALLQSILRGDVIPSESGRLDAMLARDARAVVAALAAQDDRAAGPQRLHGLVAAAGVSGLAALLEAAAVDEAPALAHVPAVLQACARGHAGFPLAAAWCDVLDAALAAPAGGRAVHVQARVPGAPVQRLRPVSGVATRDVPAWRAPWPERAAAHVLRGLLAEAGRRRAGSVPAMSAPAPGQAIMPRASTPMPESLSRHARGRHREAARLVEECAALATLLAETARDTVADFAPSGPASAALTLAQVADHLEDTPVGAGARIGTPPRAPAGSTPSAVAADARANTPSLPAEPVPEADADEARAAALPLPAGAAMPSATGNAHADTVPPSVDLVPLPGVGGDRANMPLLPPEPALRPDAGKARTAALPLPHDPVPSSASGAASVDPLPAPAHVPHDARIDHADTLPAPADPTLPSAIDSAGADARRPASAGPISRPAGDRNEADVPLLGGVAPQPSTGGASLAASPAAGDNDDVRVGLPAANDIATATPPSVPDAAGWRTHIRNLLGTVDPVLAARRRTMLDAIDAAAADHPAPRAFLQRVAQTLARRDPLDLDAEADRGRAADGHARNPAAAARAAIAHMLSTPDDAPPPAAWRALLADRPEAVRTVMRALGSRAAWRGALADTLPERMLADLMQAADPALAAALRDVQRHADAFASVFGGAPSRRLWRGTLAVFGAGDVPTADRAALCERIVRSAAGANPAAQAAAYAAWRATRTPPPAASTAQRIERASAAAAAAAATATATATATASATGPARPAAAATPRNEQERHPATWRIDATSIPWPGMGAPSEDHGIQPGERIALDNAGIVLAAPYLPRLFAVLDLVRDGAFVDAAAAERAVHLLQYAASGETDAPEYRLVFNKLLCGLPPEAPVPAAVELTQDERTTVESLLEALIASWSAIGRTSVAGLRQTFLMRAGELKARSDDWQLKVAAGPFDMLMDRLPWSFSIVKFAWMPLPVHVTWRE